ncbi:MAG: exodeoxyribonuclease VII large subunit [Deltaproteobacteria bacterium]|nr:exodeoxyribonuclease VII large subunit [Deltaproteobacteria bacterium]
MIKNTMGESRRDVLSVSDLTARVKRLLEQQIGSVYVQGELSNFRVVASGHGYGTLKDDHSQVRIALFRNTLGALGFAPGNGMQVLLRGRVTLYEARGEYQIVGDWMEEAGAGAAASALRQLHERLKAEGLFDEARKRPLPFLPRRIGVATSPTGAAIHDVLRVLGRRYENLHVLLSPCKVQGVDAPAEIVSAIELLEKAPGVDLILLTRGGGSAEDLTAFNDERVVRAIVRSPVPVVSAVGHEIDYTLADLAADLRCPTPSAAAEMIVREKSTLVENVTALDLRLAAAASSRLGDLRRRLAETGRRLLHPRRRIEQTAQRIDEMRERLARTGRRLLSDRRAALAGASAMARLEASARHHVHLARARLQGTAGKLQSLSPLAILDRGYSITRALPAYTVVRSPAEAPPGSRVEIRLSGGALEAEVQPTGGRRGASGGKEQG